MAFPDWCRQQGLPTPGGLTTGSAPLYELRTTNAVLQFQLGRDSVLFNGVQVHLGFSPRLVHGEPCFYFLDLEKTIQPLLLDAQHPWLGPNPIVVIDPGHGGENAGTRSILDGHYEKEFTLDWAQRLQELLTAEGWQVFLTRRGDTDMALSNRVAFADQHHAALFLSLHFNSAAPSQTEAGLETYCLTPAGLPSTITRGYGDDLQAVFPNNTFDRQNLLLALAVHRALLEVNGHHDRGIRHARFPGVLRGQNRPALLIEGGYLSNPREAHLIEQPAYRQQLAQAIADALTQQLGPRDVAGPGGAAALVAGPMVSPTNARVPLDSPAGAVPGKPAFQTSQLTNRITGDQPDVPSHTPEPP